MTDNYYVDRRAPVLDTSDPSVVARPVSNAELAFVDSQIRERFRLSDVYARHESCGHVYRTKRGGRKERYVTNRGVDARLDDLTCSVCFKLRVSDPREIPANCADVCCNDESNATLSLKWLEDKAAFYKWLYQHDYVDSTRDDADLII